MNAYRGRLSRLIDRRRGGGPACGRIGDMVTVL